jgi:hypothetical protein
MPLQRSTAHCRWTRLDAPVDVRMDGKTSAALILKPDARKSADAPEPFHGTLAGSIDD